MAIPRLDPANSPYNLSVTIGVKLLPYFQVWYNREKRAGETPPEFALRQLKEKAVMDYLNATVPAEQKEINAAQKAALEALDDDMNALREEVNG